MTKQEIKTALELLGDRVDRSETMSNGQGGLVLTVYMTGGAQKVFHSLYAVEQWLQNRPY